MHRAPLRTRRSPRIHTQPLRVQPIVPSLPRTTRSATPDSRGETGRSALLARVVEELPFQRKARLEPRSSTSRKASRGEVGDRLKGGGGQTRRDEGQPQGDQLTACIVVLCLVYLCVWEAASCASEVSYNMSGRWRVAIIEDRKYVCCAIGVITAQIVYQGVWSKRNSTKPTMIEKSPRIWLSTPLSHPLPIRNPLAVELICAWCSINIK